MKTKFLLTLLSVSLCLSLSANEFQITIDGKSHKLQLDQTHLLLDAYASQESPYVARTLQTLGEMSADGRTLTLPKGTVVYVAPGVYWTDLTYKQGFPYDDSGFVFTERPLVGLTILGDDVSFIGLTDNPKDVHIAGNRGEGGAKGLGASGSWYTLAVSSGFSACNITIANYAQQDLVYERDPSQNMPMRINSMNHAEVLRGAQGATLDRIRFENVHFIGYLNMMAGFGPLRAYWKNCLFQCTDDSIFGGMINVYENCTFLNCGDHPSAVAAGPGGINALLGCTLVGMPQMTSVQLNFNKVSRGNGAEATSIYAIIDCHFSGRTERVEWENVVRPDARHAVSNNTIGQERKPLVISPAQPQTSVTYSGQALRAFKVGDQYNVYNLLRGDDGWNPSGQQELTERLPYRFLIGTSTNTLYSDRTGEGNIAVLTPASAPVGSGNPEKTEWQYDRALLDGTIDRATGALTLSAKPNTTGAIVTTLVTATLPNGIAAGATLRIYPLPVDAPILKAPRISIDQGAALIGYTPDAQYKDVSMVEWYRETSATSTDGIHIGTMHNDSAGLFVGAPYLNYKLDTYDVGYYLRAVVTPKYEFSAFGEPITLRSERAIAPSDVTSSELETDFSNLNIAIEDPKTTFGRWFFDYAEPDTQLPWAWGIGTNGSEGRWGLMNNTRGKNTRMAFAQTGRYGDMSLQLDYSPGKVEGQGFGGSGCYLDIYIKYDPATRSGYGLRIERVPATTSGTQWTLYRYEGETLTALSQSILTAAFMPDGHITLRVEGNTLRVDASTGSTRTPLQAEQNLSERVSLLWTDASGALAGNQFGGFGLRINNSGSASYIYGGAGTNNCVMLHRVSVAATKK